LTPTPVPPTPVASRSPFDVLSPGLSMPFAFVVLGSLLALAMVGVWVGGLRRR
jgi:hypothetical protein